MLTGDLAKYHAVIFVSAWESKIVIEFASSNLRKDADLNEDKLVGCEVEEVGPYKTIIWPSKCYDLLQVAEKISNYLEVEKMRKINRVYDVSSDKELSSHKNVQSFILASGEVMREDF